MSVDLNELTDEQLEQALAERQKKKQRDENARRHKYEMDRENLVNDLWLSAEQIHDLMVELKRQGFQKLEQFHEVMQQYGDVSGNSKGGFSIRNGNDTFRIQYKIHQNKGFDERADMAEELLKKFLETFVKKANKKVYALVMSLLERTRGGDFDINLINRLYSMENEFTDENWVKAIKLFKESYQATNSTKYITFKKRNERGEFEALNLNFASVRV